MKSNKLFKTRVVDALSLQFISLCVIINQTFALIKRIINMVIHGFFYAACNLLCLACFSFCHREK